MSDESTTGTVQTADPASSTTPPADPATTETQPATGEETIDWKARSREWEKRSKANASAVEELAALKARTMSDSEKAVADAEKRGRDNAAKEYGRQIAQAKFEAAAAAKGLDLGEATDLIDTSKFLTDKGEVDEAAIKSAVAKLAKLAAVKPAGPSRSSGEMPGAPGDTAPISEDQLSRMTPEQITEAFNAGRLKHLM